MLTFRTLGTLDLTDEQGRRIDPVVRQPRLVALLCYLALGPGGMRRRASVIAAFWPEADERRARHSLNQALYSLRRHMGGSVVSNGPDEIGVDPDQLACDAVECTRLVREGRPDAAVRLYGGEFAAGLSIPGADEFQHWLDCERHRLRNLARDAAVAAADRSAAQGHLDAAVGLLRAAQRWAPHEDSIILRLTDLLESRGDRTGAILALREHSDRLRTELDLGPSAELQSRVHALFDRIGADLVEPVAPSFPDPPSGMPDRRRPGPAAILVSLAVLLIAWAAGALRGHVDTRDVHASDSPAALGAFEAGLHALETQEFGKARDQFARAIELDTAFAAAALEGAWAQCCRDTTAVHRLITIARRHAGRLTRAQREHLYALEARIGDDAMGLYRGLREAARLDPQRYALDFATLAMDQGRWEEAIDAAGRAPRRLFGGNYWFVVNVSLHALGRFAETADSFRLWRGANPEWERPLLLMEAGALGAAGHLDTLFARVHYRRSLPGGEWGAFSMLRAAGGEMLVHGRPGARQVLDSAIATHRAHLAERTETAIVETYYLAGQHADADSILRSFAAEARDDSLTLMSWAALIAARRGDQHRADSLRRALCTLPARLAARVSSDRLLLCARIASVSGRRDDALTWLDAAIRHGLGAEQILHARHDLGTLADDPALRRPLNLGPR